jgi:hypothetical protein
MSITFGADKYRRMMKGTKFSEQLFSFIKVASIDASSD